MVEVSEVIQIDNTNNTTDNVLDKKQLFDLGIQT